MSIDPLLKRRERGIAYVGAIAAAVFATAGASAQVTQPTDTGVMSFPNVRVVTATPTGVQAPAATSAAAGLRAFIDPETGQLTENPTAAHLADLYGPQSAPIAKRGPGPGVGWQQTNRGIAIMLDDSHMLFSLARHGQAGQLEQACLPGDDLAQRFLAAQGKVPTHSHKAHAKGDVQ